MSEFEVTTSTGSYRVTIGAGSFANELAHGGHDLILADSYFAEAIADVALPAVLVDADERRKNLVEIDRILGEFSDHGLTRAGSVIALGGGVVQDLGTFAASVYMRGVAWTYVPTTLMAMADSCIGGKSSLNVSGAKNLAGNIYPPSAVVVDPAFIATLQAEEVAAGLGEAVKIAFCAGPAVFESYLRHYEDRTHWEPLIEGVLCAKKWFVETDEFDRAERRLLNFGHTFGHALEAATDFSVNHGVAVIVGMLAAAAFRREVFTAEGADQPLREHCGVILSAVPKLRPRLERADMAKFLAAFLKDKKHPPDGLRVVLPKADVIGVEEVSLPRSAEVLGAVEAALLAAFGEAGVKYADLVVEWLESEGYTHCFFVAGGNIMHLLDGVRRRLTCVPFVHEVAAGIAAEYFNEASDGPKAFVLVTAGPGLTNLVTALAGAFLESRELLVLGGQVKREDLASEGLRQRGIQEVDGVAIAGPVTLRSVRIEQPIAKSEFLDHVHAGVARRPGPVFLELCLDAQGAVVDRAELEPPGVGTSEPLAVDRADADAAARSIIDAVGRSARPVLLIGGGVSRRIAAAVVRDLATWGVPVMTTWNGADRLASDHPLYFGRPNTWGQRSSNVLLQQADLVIALGTRLGLQQTGFNWQQFAPLAVVAQVDIDETELAKGHPRVDLAFAVDADAVLTTLVRSAPPEISEWREFCREVRRLLPIEEPGNVTGPGYVDPFHFVVELSAFCESTDVVIPCSSGGAFTVAMQAFLQKAGQLVVTDKGLASMGYGLSGAVGAALATGRRTFLLEGDGGFTQNLQELATVAVNDLPLKIFLFSNEGYASIRMTQRNYFEGGYLGCDTKTGLGFPSWPELFGAYRIPILELDEAWSASTEFRSLLSSGGPAGFILPIDPEQTYYPKIVSRVTATGSMESNPLHLMSPDLAPDLAENVFRYLPGVLRGESR